MCLGFRFSPQLGACERQLIDVSLSHCCFSPLKRRGTKVLAKSGYLVSEQSLKEYIRMNSTRHGRETQARKLHVQGMEVCISTVNQRMNGKCKSLVRENGGNGPSSWPWTFHWEERDPDGVDLWDYTLQDINISCYSGADSSWRRGHSSSLSQTQQVPRAPGAAALVPHSP